jgi:hypothetical protein
MNLLNFVPSASVAQTLVSPPMTSPYLLCVLAKWTLNIYQWLKAKRGLMMLSKLHYSGSVHCMQLECSRVTS